MKQVLNVGSKVKLIAPSPCTDWCEYDDVRGRVSKHVKNVIRERFFKADPKLTAEIVHVPGNEREKLRKAGERRSASGCPAARRSSSPSS
jgi:hypothetical protein